MCHTGLASDMWLTGGGSETAGTKPGVLGADQEAGEFLGTDERVQLWFLYQDIPHLVVFQRC